MDLIYTDADGNDVGVLKYYDLDLAYGIDENNFALTVQRSQNLLDIGAFIYVEEISEGKIIGTECGGIMDSIKTDTVNDQVIYEGRTWHGVLAQIIIEPEADYDYYEADGDFNEVCGVIIEKLGIGNLFYVEDEASEIEIEQYQFARYVDAYTGLKSMLNTVNAKLKLRYNSTLKKVLIYAEIISDFSDDEEWDSDQMDFTAKVNYRPVNHLICLGQGELADRAVIHLFLDADNALQDYAITDEPLEAEDYILDKSKQVLFGKDEVAEVYDYSSAEIVENYISLDDQPDNWLTACDQYYCMAIDDYGNADYDNVNFEEYSYALLTAQPKDWAICYMNYFKLSGEEYVAVEKTETDIYSKVTTVPSDWKKNYSSYYKNADGAYSSIEGVKKYSLLSYKPADWLMEYKKYYIKKDGAYTAVSKASTTYGFLTKKPSNWKTAFSDYYTKSGSEYIEAEEVINYIITTKKPSNWSKKFAEYFTTNGYTYTAVSGESTSKYHLQSVKPSDWKTGYTNYFYKSGASYKQLESTAKDNYATITKKPRKWNSTYSDYYIRFWDGVKIVYTSVSSRTKYTYEKQRSSKAPSDWKDNYGNYYKLNSKGKYVKVEGVKKGKTTVAPTWKKNKYYTQYSSSVTPNFDTVIKSSYGRKLAYKTTKETAPVWKRNKYYTKETLSTKAPTWVANKYYRQDKKAPTWVANKYYKALGDVVPAWKTNTYYRYVNEYAPSFSTQTVYEHITAVAPAWTTGKYYYAHDWKKAPIFKPGVYFRLAHDYYKTMVLAGIEKLQGYIDADEIDVSSDMSSDYDVGDIVGASDNITGLAVWQPITKKIIKISAGSITLSYEIGGNQ